MTQIKSNITLVAAMDYHQGIGYKNQLPWKLPEDLAHFKRVTLGKPIIMGRTTFEAIGRPLPGRTNIVVTRNLKWQAPNDVVVFSSLNDCIWALGDREMCIVGGADVYRQTLPYARRMILTRIFNNFECDTFFPKFDLNDWIEVSRENHTSKTNSFDYAFIEYRRRLE